MTDRAPAESRTRRTVPLRDLAIAPENMRFGEPADAEVPQLARTILAAGVLMPLTTRPGRRKEKPHMVLDGRRRLLALEQLLEAGEIDDSYPVEVIEVTDPAAQAAGVLLTNTAAPVHVADVIVCIGKMLKSKLTLGAVEQGPTERARAADLAGDEAVPLLREVLKAWLRLARAGHPGRTVTAVVLWPAGEFGLDVRFYAAPVLERDLQGEDETGGRSLGSAAIRMVDAVGVPTPEVETEGVPHALHEVRTDMATHGLIRALADCPDAALIALTARLFTVLVLETARSKESSALAITVEAYGRPNQAPVAALDGEVRRRLAERRAAYEASQLRPIPWIATLSAVARFGLLAELVALSLDLREARTRAPSRRRLGQVRGRVWRLRRPFGAAPTMRRTGARWRRGRYAPDCATRGTPDRTAGPSRTSPPDRGQLRRSPMASADSSGWTDARVARLKSLWLDGLSASQIAKALGGLTRNAVIGKVHRLGLCGVGRVRLSNPCPAKAARASPRRVKPRVKLPAPGVGAVAPPLAPPMAAGLYGSLRELPRGCCKWPIGDPLAEGFSFCGHAAPTGPYCAWHVRLAYRQPVSPDQRTVRGAREQGRAGLR